MDLDVLFKGMREASFSGAKTYMDYGRYVVELKDLRVKNSDKDGVPVFICKFAITESDNPKHSVGSEGSWTLKGKSLQFGMADLKALMFAILGLEGSKIPPDDPAHAAASLLLRFFLGSDSAKKEIEAMPEEQRLAPDFYVGKCVRLECKRKSAEKDFTRHFWSPV